MKVGFAKHVAREWVMQHSSEVDGFLGAYFAGSIAEKHDEDELSK